MADGSADLKGLIAQSRKQPLNFAICLGKKPEKSVFLIHKQRAPEALGRDAKKAGETPKVAFGKIESKGAEIRLSCFEDPPGGLGKQCKKFLASQNIPAKVVVLDPSGNEIPDDDEVAAAAQAQSEPGAAANTDAAQWAQLFARLDGLVAQAAGPKADQIKAAWTAAINSAEKGDPTRAVALGKKVAAALKAEGKGDVDPAAAQAALKEITGRVLEIAKTDPRIKGDMGPLIKQATTLLKAGTPEVSTAIETAQERLKTWEKIAEGGGYHPFEKTLAELEARADKLIAAFPKVTDPDKQLDIIRTLESIKQKIEAGRLKLRT